MTAPAETSEGILLALDYGIDLVTDARTTRILEGRSIEVALPDLTGGVVFQESGQYEQGWPPDPVPIEWIAEIGADPVVLVDGAGANALTPVQVAWIDEEPQLLYRRMTVLDEEGGDQITHLVLANLADGAEEVLGIIGAYESDFTAVDVGGDKVLVTWLGYGGEGACAGVTGLTALLTLTADDWVGSACGEECCVYGPNPGRVQVRSGVVHAALSPDGISLALLVTEDDGSWRLDEVHLETDELRHVMEQTAEEGVWPTAIDYDGSSYLIDLDSPTGQGEGANSVLYVDSTGSVIQTIDARSGSFWIFEP